MAGGLERDKRGIRAGVRRNGEVIERGDFDLDGVTFPATEVRLGFLDPFAPDPKIEL